MKHHLVVTRTRIRILTLSALLLTSTLVRADTITHSQQRIDIQYPSTLDSAQRQQTYAWLQHVASALLTVYGEWPKDNFNITVQTSTSTRSPVPWGQVTRGSPDNVLLVINPEADPVEISSDWTAFHELSHLLIPYSGDGDLWFSEGLASYYQNIIQARAGLLTETELWNKLAAGFERGRKQDQLPQLELVEISDHMRKYRNFMRVHWSGVHYWLSADVKLRQLSQNRITLDTLLKQLKDCCQHRSMSAAAIADQLDQLAGASIFKPRYLEYRASRAMPDYAPILTELGVVVHLQNNAHKVSLKTDAPHTDIRLRIYQGNG